MSNALVPYAASGPVGAAAPAGAASAARAALSLYKPTGAPGRTGDPVADLEAKLKYINETVPNRVTNVSGRRASEAAERPRREPRAHAPPQHRRRGLGRLPRLPDGALWRRCPHLH